MAFESLLRRQWDYLRAWLEDVDVLRHREQAVGLGTWTVGDLVAHLGLGLGMLTEITPADDDQQPVSFGTYVSAYPPAAADISEATQKLARSLEPDLLEGVDAITTAAWRALSRNHAHVVLGRRGPITRDDYVMTRLLELVVHGEDLNRALPIPTESPVLPDACAQVASALVQAYVERGGGQPDVPDALGWIRLATGRIPSADELLPLL